MSLNAVDASGAPQDGAPAGSSASPLTLAGIAALLASTCCVVPLVFVLLGISGTWIGQLRRLEPYSGMLTAVGIAALLVAGWRIYRTPRTMQCESPESCVPANRAARRWFWVVAVLTLVPVVVEKTAHFFY